MSEVSEITVRCGFIGLGDQGAPIARRMIDAGFPTILWARRAGSLTSFEGSGAHFAESIESVGEQAEHVGVCVVNDSDVREVCRGLIPAMRAGSRIAIHSTVSPQTCRHVAEDASKHGISVIDAPVSGGAPAAQAGKLILMLGGDPEVIALARPVFETFASLIVRAGDLGAGQHVKLLNNSLLAAHIGLADASLRASEALGLDREAIVEILLSSSGRSFGLEVASRMKDPSAFRHGGKLLKKDLQLLADLLGEQDLATRLLRHAAEPFLAAASGGEEQTTVV